MYAYCLGHPTVNACHTSLGDPGSPFMDGYTTVIIMLTSTALPEYCCMLQLCQSISKNWSVGIEVTHVVVMYHYRH